MSATPYTTAFSSLTSGRWRTVALGLRLAKSGLGAIVIGCSFGLVMFGGIFAILALLVLVGSDSLEDPRVTGVFGLIGILIALVAVSTLLSKFSARLLWCAVPDLPVARLLAYTSVVGRTVILGVIIYICCYAYLGDPVRELIRSPAMLPWSLAGWLGLGAEWGYLRALRQHLRREDSSPCPPADTTQPLPRITRELPGDPEHPKKNILFREPGPYILLILGFILESLDTWFQRGPTGLLSSALFMTAVTPAFLQLFWLGGANLVEILACIPRGERTERARLRGHPGAVLSVAFSTEGKTLASGGDDKLIELWDVTVNQERATLREPGEVLSAEFSPDGRSLALGCEDGTIRLWDMDACQERATLKGHFCRAASIPVLMKLPILCGLLRVDLSMAFALDGKTLVSADTKGAIKLWDVKSGHELETFGNYQDIYCVALSPDGMTLASGGEDKTIKLWDVPG